MRNKNRFLRYKVAVSNYFMQLPRVFFLNIRWPITYNIKISYFFVGLRKLNITYLNGKFWSNLLYLCYTMHVQTNISETKKVVFCKKYGKKHMAIQELMGDRQRFSSENDT